MDPKVTVIMPVYNGELYVEEAVASLLAQSFRDWELIIVDDGSVDSTAQILETFTDQRIHIIRQKNSGEACARNVGLNNARGEYIAFLDADDSYFPNALEDLSSFLDMFSQYDVVFSDGQICDEYDRPIMRLSEIRPGIYTGQILEQVVISSSIVTVPVCTMTRRSKILEHSVHFDQNLVIGPDWDFWIQLAVHVKFGYLDKSTCKYRIHTTNITRTTGLEKRRKDHFYRCTKIMNSEWFTRLSLPTREFFFLDLLTNTLSGDSRRQWDILQMKQFAQLSPSRRADLWRMVGIDALNNGCDMKQVKSYFTESLHHNSNDHKTQLLLRSVSIGRPFALALVSLWHVLLATRKKLESIGNTRSEHLQRLLGLN
jgi:glycosyltransferase involved in cell wall biosynthesis